MKELAYTPNQEIYIPDVEIKVDCPEYIYVPLRGYAYSLAVFDIEDKSIGWIRTSTLGYDSVKDWMIQTKWIDRGY